MYEQQRAVRHAARVAAEYALYRQYCDAQYSVGYEQRAEWAARAEAQAAVLRDLLEGGAY